MLCLMREHQRCLKRNQLDAPESGRPEVMSCKRQCDWDDNQVCRSCGIDYSVPEVDENNDSKTEKSTD